MDDLRIVVEIEDSGEVRVRASRPDVRASIIFWNHFQSAYEDARVQGQQILAAHPYEAVIAETISVGEA